MMVFQILGAREMALERLCDWELMWVPRAAVERVALTIT